jgi:ligand-binding sensor domain-containing protein
MQIRLFFLFFGLAVLIGAPLQSQFRLPVGGWDELLPYQRGSYVTQSDTEIFYTTGLSILILDKEELSTRTLARADGLAETRIRLLRYHGPSETLIIVYENSTIDLYRQGQFETLPQINNFNFTGGDNRINAIFLDGNTAYLAAGFGVSALDLDRSIFRFTTFTGVPVQSVAVHENRIWAGTAEGIYRVDIGGTNLDDFTNWAYLGTEAGFPALYETTALGVYRGELLFNIDTDLYRWTAQGPERFFSPGEPERMWIPQYISTEGEQLLVGYRCRDGSCVDRRLFLFNAERQLINNVLSNCVGIVTSAVQDQRGRIWLGDEWNGVRLLRNAGEQNCQTLTFPGPVSARAFDLEIIDGVLWGVAGAYETTLSPVFYTEGLFKYEAGTWTYFNRDTEEAFRGRDGQKGGDDDLFAMVDLTHDPSTGNIFASSWLEGLVEYDPTVGTFTLYDEINTPMQNARGEAAGRVRAGGLSVDEDGTLWLINNNALDGKPIIARDAAGTWYAMGDRCARTGAFDLTIDGVGYKWVLNSIENGGGVLVFDEGELNNPGDDRCRIITQGNSELPTNQTRSLVTDLDGDVWVGTAQGVVIFECGTTAIENCPGDHRVVEQDGFTGRLLETEDVLALAVDGANRKWVGTASGVFLLSADGREEIAFLNEDNSPLLANRVNDIAIDPETGLVYFATVAGISVYQSDATRGGRVHRAELEVFPNPVRPDYAGPITIRGLARDANVKITDISGKLIYETQARGGQATWFGTDYNGRRAQTGVYLIFATSDPRSSFDNPDAAVGKVVFIN